MKTWLTSPFSLCTNCTFYSYLYLRQCVESGGTTKTWSSLPVLPLCFRNSLLVDRRSSYGAAAFLLHSLSVVCHLILVLDWKNLEAVS